MIGIISDTHDNVANILKAVELFKNKNVDFVVHCGDIVAPATIRFFRGLSVRFVKGNCDGDIEHLKTVASQIGCTFLGEFAEFEYLNKSFAVYHGHNPEFLERLINSGKYHYILTGHTHQSRDESVGGTRILNPGSHYYRSENLVVLLDAEKDNAEFIKVG